MRAVLAATVAAAMPRASSAGSRVTPASSTPIPASLKSAASASYLSAVSGFPPSSPPCEPVTTIVPTCSGLTAEAESSAHTAGGSGISRNGDSSAGGGSLPLVDASASAAAAARQGNSARQPSATAGRLAWVMTPRAIMLAPSPMRAVGGRLWRPGSRVSEDNRARRSRPDASDPGIVENRRRDRELACDISGIKPPWEPLTTTAPVARGRCA